jgi:hypothetical protein
MFEHRVDDLEHKIHRVMSNRETKIQSHIGKLRSQLYAENSAAVYDEISELSRHTELMSKELRDILIELFSEMQTGGIQPTYRLYPRTRSVTVREDNGCIIITMEAMLPFPIKGSSYFLHEKLDTALERFYEEHKPPRPYFTERCAVVFLHHYGSGAENLRHLRDYDNVEHRCVTNVLAAHLLWGDSPKCMIALDVLAPGESNYTEIRVMPITQFRAFVMSESIEYSP